MSFGGNYRAGKRVEPARGLTGVAEAREASPEFAWQLLGAFRAMGLDAAPSRGGDSITFCCPACDFGTLTAQEGRASCNACSWAAAGEPWAIAEAAKRQVPLVAAVTGNGLPLVDLDAILGYVPDESEEIWPDGVLSKGLPTAIIGAPGVGKSRLSLQAALATITGRKFLGWETKGQSLRWLILQTENSMRRLKMDLEAMTRHMTVAHKAEIRDRLRILNIQAMDFATICMAGEHPDRERIRATLNAWQPDVVVIDPLRDAGSGDPNKDADMIETCQGIARTLRESNPRRACLAVHHGRTGAAEASKVFGDDAASFGRNSKVLHGWLRSQINVASAGIDNPDVVIVGCGKCSDGPKWEPFAARLDSTSMVYHRLDPEDFDLEEWSEKQAGGGRKKRGNNNGAPAVERVIEAMRNADGRMPGGINDLAGLPERLRKMTGCSRAEALKSIQAALKSGVIEEEKGRTTKDGGRPGRVYILHEKP